MVKRCKNDIWRIQKVVYLDTFVFPMLEKEFQYFIQHQNDLVKKHNGKYIVLRGEEIVGVFDTIADAYEDSIKKFPPGTFFIQKCIPGTSAYTQTFNSRVIFA